MTPDACMFRLCITFDTSGQCLHVMLCGPTQLQAWQCQAHSCCYAVESAVLGCAVGLQYLHDCWHLSKLSPEGRPGEKSLAAVCACWGACCGTICLT